MNYIVVKQTKSTGIAILLTLVFGPVGLFYASITGGVVMTSIPVGLFVVMVLGLFKSSSALYLGSFFLLVLFACSFWIICTIWAAIAVSSYNNRINKEASNYYIESNTFNSRNNTSYDASENDILVVLIIGCILIALVTLVYKNKHWFEASM